MSRANDKLNERISKKGFAEVPPNTEFIKRDRYNSYRSVLSVFSSLDEYERKQQEQPLVDDRGFKALDEAEESFD